MSATPKKRFVGFGFGPIQSALFLFEAFRSGNFGSFVVAEVDAAAVAAVRSNGGRYAINIAYPDRIEKVVVEGVELLNPGVPADRAKLIDAVAQADEICTALPSIKFFDVGGATSVAGALAEGLAKRPAGKPGIIYTAENHNHAAEELTAILAQKVPGGVPASVQVLNTVIGKMSGVISDAPTIQRLKLAPLTPTGPGATRAVLVEEFNRILISKLALPGYTRGIGVFAEKSDLLPFEEAKLYGHNAIHALIGYLAQARGLENMAAAAGHADLMATARQAFIGESGAALIKKHGALGDPLFTPAGYRAYAEDLLVRIVNPNLNDLVVRVIRDPIRKLGWEDRLFGTMRVALEFGVEPTQMAKGAAAAVKYLIATQADLKDKPKALPASVAGLTKPALDALLREVWGAKVDGHAAKMIALTGAAL